MLAGIYSSRPHLAILLVMWTKIVRLVCVQPCSSGRDVDIRGPEAISETDDTKRKSTCTTRASPALAHGADEGFSVVKEQSDVAVSAGNEDDNVAPSALQNRSGAAAVAASDDRSSGKNSYHSVRSLKHKNDRSYKYGTGSADLHRASSLQDFTDSAVERSRPPAAENAVSCGCMESDDTSDVQRLHGLLSSLCGACSTDAGCMRCSRSPTAHAGEQSPLSPRRSRCRMRRAAANLELESVGSTGIVSNTARFWEDLMQDSSRSAAHCGFRPRHVSEGRRRFMRRDGSSPRYSTVGALCDIRPLHDVVCMPTTASDVLSQLEFLHVNSDLEVCFYHYVTVWFFMFDCLTSCMCILY